VKTQASFENEMNSEVCMTTDITWRRPEFLINSALQFFFLSAAFLHFAIVNRCLFTDLRLLSGGLQLLREEHATRWLKRNIVDRIHFDLSETLSTTTGCVR